MDKTIIIEKIAARGYFCGGRTSRSRKFLWRMGVVSIAVACGMAQAHAQDVTSSVPSAITSISSLKKSKPTGNLAKAPVKSAVPKRKAKPVVVPAHAYLQTAPCSGSYCMFRGDEDFSYLRDVPKDQQTDFFDPLKFIPLDQKGDIFLTVNGTERLEYYNNVLNPYIEANHPEGINLGDRDDYGMRTNLGANLQIGPYLSVYADLWNGEYIGPRADPSVTDRTTLTTENAYVQLQGPVGQAVMGIRAGRQFLFLGNGIVISDSEIATIPNTWNGVHAYANWGFASIDAFWMEEEAPENGIEDDYPQPGVQLWGAWGRYDVPKFTLLGQPGATAVEPYFLQYSDTEGTYNDPELADPSNHSPLTGPFIVGDDIRNTFGLRYHGNIGNFDLDETGEYQDGEFAGRTVSAWMYSFDNGYTFEKAAWKPRFGFVFYGASGGGSGNGQTVHTYQPLYYPSLAYNGNLIVSPTNYISFTPHIVIDPMPKLSMDFSNALMYRQNDDDAIYNGLFAGGSAINIYSETANLKGSYIGDQANLIVRYLVNRHIDLMAQFLYFMPGKVLNEVGVGDQSEGLAFATLRF